MSEIASRLSRKWPEHRIEELFAPLEDGRTLHQGWSPQCEKEPSSSEDVWGVLKTTSIQAGEFQPQHNKCLPPALEPRPLIEVKPGDIVITCAGPRARCGVSCLVRETRKRLMISGKMYRFRVDSDRTDPRYVEAFLQTEVARLAIDKMKTGSSESGLNLTHNRFRQLRIPVAPLPVQRRIVADIEKQFTRLDVGVAALRRVQANLKRYRAAVLKAACEGKLVPTEAEIVAAASRRRAGNGQSRDSSATFESGQELLQRILNERRKNWKGRGKYRESQPPDTSNLPKLPESWAWATAEQLTDENRSITYGVIKLGTHVPDGVSVLRSSDVRNLRLNLNDVKRVAPRIAGMYRRTFLKGGEVLITVRGSLGGVVVAPVECAGFNISREVAMLAMLEPAVAKTAAIFIGSAALQRWLLQRAKGIAYTGINIETLKELPVPLPPLSEQRRIVAEVERRLSVLEELEAVVSANLQRASRLRQSILQRAFEGRLMRDFCGGNAAFQMRRKR